MRITDVIFKDLRVILTDKKAVGIIILMPLILITILGSALGGSFVSEGPKEQIQVAVVKKYNVTEETKMFIDSLSNGGMSSSIDNEQLKEISHATEEFNIDKILTEDFLEDEELTKILKIQIVDEDRAMDLLEGGRISAAIILPKNFIYDMYINFFTPFRNKINIKIIGHQDKYIGAQITEGIMKGFSDMISSMIIGKNVYLETAMEEDLGFDAFEKMGDVIDGISENLENNRVTIDYINTSGRKPITGFQYYAVGMTAMFILFAAGNGGRLLLEEKDNITYQRMLIAGITKWRIVVGKFFSTFSLVFVQMTIIIFFTGLVYGVKWGSPLAVMTITLFAGFSVAGLGTLLAALTYKSNNYKAADVFQSVIINVMALLGGSFFPIDVLPGFLRVLGNFTLNGLTAKAYQRIMVGFGIADIVTYLIGLAAMGTVFTVLAIFILMREEGWSYAKYNKAQNYTIEG